MKKRIIKMTRLNSLTNVASWSGFDGMSRLLFLMVMLMFFQSAWAQTDSTAVKNDSVTWNQTLEGITIKAQRQFSWSYYVFHDNS